MYTVAGHDKYLDGCDTLLSDMNAEWAVKVFHGLLHNLEHRISMSSPVSTKHIIIFKDKGYSIGQIEVDLTIFPPTSAVMGELALTDSEGRREFYAIDLSFGMRYNWYSEAMRLVEIIEAEVINRLYNTAPFMVQLQSRDSTHHTIYYVGERVQRLAASFQRVIMARPAFMTIICHPFINGNQFVLNCEGDSRTVEAMLEEAVKNGYIQINRG